jgi:hypothetical protein
MKYWAEWQKRRGCFIKWSWRRVVINDQSENEKLKEGRTKRKA